MGVLINVGGGALAEVSTADAEIYYQSGGSILPAAYMNQPQPFASTVLPGPNSDNQFFFLEQQRDGTQVQTMNLMGVMANLYAILQSAPVDIYEAEAKFFNAARMYCTLHASAPGCENPDSVAEQYAQQYKTWAAVAPEYQNPALATPIAPGAPIPPPVFVDPATGRTYGFNELVAMTPTPNSPVAVARAVAETGLTAMEVSQAQARGLPLIPLIASEAATAQEAAALEAAGVVIGNTPGSTEASPSSFDTTEVTNWIKANWVLLAAGVGALLILPALIPRRD